MAQAEHQAEFQRRGEQPGRHEPAATPQGVGPQEQQQQQGDVERAEADGQAKARQFSAEAEEVQERPTDWLHCGPCRWLQAAHRGAQGLLINGARSCGLPGAAAISRGFRTSRRRWPPPGWCLAR